MKKYAKLFFLLSMLFILSGCGNKEQEGKKELEAPAKENASNNQKEESTGGLFSGSIKDLLAKGSDMQCTWSSTDDSGGKISGTVYVSGSKFFQDFSMTQPGMGEIKSYVMSDGEWIYQWSSMAKMGTKMKMDEVKKMAEDVQKDISSRPTGDQEKNGKGVDLNNKVDYDCQKWNVDNSKFKLPSDIQFNDFSQMMNNLPKNNGAKLNDPCQVCNSLPAEAKSACLESCDKEL